jgi:hypothetical protein
MAWKLEIYWGYRGRDSSPPLIEEFNTKAEGITRATEVLSDGYSIDAPGRHELYPASGITSVVLADLGEE